VSVIHEILTKRREVQLKNQRPATIEIGELKARQLADEINEHGPPLIDDEGKPKVATWKDIVSPDARLFGMSVVGAAWPDFLSIRAEGQSELPAKYQKSTTVS
jgi:hypothetical protein